jgi:hypothetical protein
VCIVFSETSISERQAPWRNVLMTQMRRPTTLTDLACCLIHHRRRDPPRSRDRLQQIADAFALLRNPSASSHVVMTLNWQDSLEQSGIDSRVEADVDGFFNDTSGNARPTAETTFGGIVSWYRRRVRLMAGSLRKIEIIESQSSIRERSIFELNHYFTVSRAKCMQFYNLTPR